MCFELLSRIIASPFLSFILCLSTSLCSTLSFSAMMYCVTSNCYTLSCCLVIFHLSLYTFLFSYSSSLLIPFHTLSIYFFHSPSFLFFDLYSTSIFLCLHYSLLLSTPTSSHISYYNLITCMKSADVQYLYSSCYDLRASRSPTHKPDPSFFIKHEWGRHRRQWTLECLKDHVSIF